MKKAIIALVAIIMPLSILATEPKIENFDASLAGTVSISCSEIFFGKPADKVNVSLALNANQYNSEILGNDTQYYIVLNTSSNNRIAIKEGNALLFRLGDGELIHLKSLMSSEGRNLDKNKRYYIYTSYIISIDELKKIVTHGITKIRVETLAANYDFDVSKAQSENLIKEYNLINAEIGNKPDDITEDF